LSDDEIERCVLDTSALFALTDEEPGAGQVESLLEGAREEKVLVGISSISLMEVYYIALRESSEDVATNLVALLKSWPVQLWSPDERILLRAGRLKAGYRLSLADAIIASTAIEWEAHLVHKDPEMQALRGEVALVELPLKAPGDP
jgi:predicted nucleic acid-binding protein